MSLEQYRRPRRIVLHPDATAYDAARAMVDNHVGVLLIARERQLAGIVTDRDLVCEVMAGGLDSSSTIDARTAGDIIRSQLEQPARYKREGAVHPEGIARQDVFPRGARALTRLACAGTNRGVF